MGFMDKAKKLAEQAQEKLDEAQKNINKPAGGQEPGGQAGQGVRYDDQGRPIEEGPPAGQAPPPPAQPGEPTAPAAGEPAPEQAPPPPKRDTGGTDPNPDPFKPIE